MVALKLLNIMKKTGYIMKDGKIDMGTKGSYTVLTERKVLQTLRPHFVDQGLVIIPIEVTHIEKTGSTTTVAMKYKIIDTEDGDSEIVASVGQGTSTGDKGAGSAFTYSLKYLMTKSTLQESGDDPDLTGDNVHVKEKDKNMELAVKLAQEVSALISGGMIASDMGQGMIAYLEENANDPAVLREAETNINQMKNRKK